MFDTQDFSRPQWNPDLLRGLCVDMSPVVLGATKQRR